MVQRTGTENARLTWLNKSIENRQRIPRLICWMGTPTTASQRVPETRGECPPNARLLVNMRGL